MRNRFPVDTRTSQSLCGPPGGAAPAPVLCDPLTCPVGATPDIIFVEDGGPQSITLGTPALNFAPLCNGQPLQVSVTGGVLPANVTLGPCAGNPNQVCAVYDGTGPGLAFNGNVVVSNGVDPPCTYQVDIGIIL